MHHKKLIIGTAQFGMKYGIANKKGIPSDNETIKIFDMGVENIYNWELRYEDYNKNYRVEIENYNITQRSNLFLINHLPTTIINILVSLSNL